MYLFVFVGLVRIRCQLVVPYVFLILDQLLFSRVHTRLLWVGDHARLFIR